MSRFVRFVMLMLVACGGQDGTQTATAAPDVDAACPDALPSVVARIDGQTVSGADLEEAAAPELIEARSALYEARKAALDNLVIERLLQAETEAKGMTEEQLLKTHVRDKIVPPTDAEIAAFFEENQAQMRGPIEAMRPQISAYLENQQATTLSRAYLTALKTQYGVETFLEAFRVDVDPEDSPRWGSADAPIEIVEFSDFQCPYCVMAAETVRQVKEKYGDQVSVVYRHFPLPMHAQAARAAEASQCAHEQQGFWKFHDALFAEQKAWTEDDFLRYAEEIGLDGKAFGRCMAEGRQAETVQDDMDDGRKVGMGGTPGFYINGVMLTGAQPVEAFVEIIDRELAAR